MRIDWSNIDTINNWIKENRNEFIAIDTKTELLYSKKERIVLINYLKNPIENAWWVKLSTIKKGHNCDHDFNGQKNYTTESFKQKLKITKPNIDLIGEFENIKKQHRFYCKECGIYFYTTPDNILTTKYGCRTCSIKKSGLNHRKSQGDFEEEVLLKFKGEFSVIGKYITQDDLIEFKHNVCGKTFITTPNRLLNGRGCDFCSMSFGERMIYNYLNDKNIPFERQKTFRGLREKYPLKFDFFIKKYNLIIEFDGKQHYTPREQFGGLKGYVDTKRRDYKKNEFCRDNNIKLIRIPYWELRNIYKILEENDIV